MDSTIFSQIFGVIFVLVTIGNSRVNQLVCGGAVQSHS